MSTSPEDPLIGQLLAGQFHIERQLGSGGMGAVYLAEQAEMGRKVVVKVMHPELTIGNPQAAERFKREARAVAALNHPHIVQVHVFGQAEDGRMYLAMELVDGRDLAQELQAGPMDQARATRILDQVASALIEAHSHGIVHRDLKPENIMLTQRHGNDDWVKVLDFGIAKVGTADSGPALTQQGAIFGTPRYMAPEQVQGGTVDARTDLYALGVILYEMLTGEHPFRANSALDYLVKHVSEAMVLPNQKRPQLHISPRLEGVLTRLLAKDQADRFQSAAELQRELRASLVEVGDPMKHTLSLSSAAVSAAVRASESAATVTAAPEGPPRVKKKSPLPWVLAGLVLVGGGVAVALGALGGSSGSGAPAVVVASAPPSAAAIPPEKAPEPTDTHVAPSEDVAPAIAAAEVQAEVAVAAAPDIAPDAAPEVQVAAAAPDVADSAVAGVAAELHRALQDVEGLPVPEGTTVAATGPTVLKLAVPAPLEAVRAFYTKALDGRGQLKGEGFTITDRRLAFTGLTLSALDGQTQIEVGRRPIAIAKPKVEVAPTPPVPDPTPTVTTPPPGRRRPRPDFGPTTPTRPGEVTAPVQPTPGQRPKPFEPRPRTRTR
jgi:serine/threonine protein kinase